MHNTTISRITVKTDVTGNPVYLDLHRAIPCGLLVTELVTNSNKHAFPNNRNGEVRIALSGQSSHRTVLSVSDKRRPAGAAAAVFDTATDGIFITNPAHHIIAVNPAFQSMTGYDDTEVIGANANALLFQEAPSADFYTRIATLPRGQWQGELHCLMKDQHPFLAWINTSLVRDMNGMTIRYVGSMTDITALRKTETQLTHLAFYDSITGLPNRQLFNDRLEQALAKERRHQFGSTLMFIDLDGFKNINDRLGHTHGDQLLRIMGERLKRSLRTGDTVARFGGNEFLVLLADVRQPSDAATVARKLLDSLIQPLDIAGLGMSISASIGIALYPADGTEFHLLLQAADTALNRAKAQGRDRFCFHTPVWLSDSTLQ